MEQSRIEEKRRMVSHLQKKINKHQLEILKLTDWVKGLNQELQDTCPHDWTPDLEANQLDGGDYHLKCTICNKKAAT